MTFGNDATPAKSRGVIFGKNQGYAVPPSWTKGYTVPTGNYCNH